MPSHRPLTLSPDNDPVWAHLHVQKVDEARVAMFLAGNALLPEPGRLKSLAFFGNTPEEAEWEAKARLEEGAPVLGMTFRSNHSLVPAHVGQWTHTTVKY